MERRHTDPKGFPTVTRVVVNWTLEILDGLGIRENL
jgi:hypothetical protein